MHIFYFFNFKFATCNACRYLRSCWLVAQMLQCLCNAGAVLELTRCTLNDSSESGLKAMSGTTTAVRCQINTNAVGNVVIEGTVSSPVVELHECEACNSSAGPGLRVFGGGAVLRASGITVRGNAKPITVASPAVPQFTRDCAVE